MKIILVRHGESEANAKGISQGQKLDSPLSKKGLEQAKKVTERLSEEKIDFIYSSDLKRAKQTAEIINKEHKLKISFDKRLRERNHGSETTEEHIKRTENFLKSLDEKMKTVVILAHGETNKMILAISTGSRKKGGKIFRETTQNNTCINIVEKEGNKYKIKLINCVKHLV